MSDTRNPVGLKERFKPAPPGRILTTTTAPLSLRVEGGTLAVGRSSLPPSSGAPRAAAGLPLRSELDLPSARLPALRGSTLAFLAAGVLLLHIGLWGADRLRGSARRRGSRHASARSVRAALRELERAASGAASKEHSAGLIEKALHEAFGDLADDDDSERARAVRVLLDEARFVRYAPQLGDYSDKVRDLAARAADTVRRWA